ncbi:hypothetical protein [Paenibacillus sp. N3.4]|uniref:hypothetical protein n=1 Tax=Paenibacillus sp. N3.4 TaxID=2603222 RepID=UPI0011C7586F|nr:hypothetical protein [Paenibacillus sp. N3.4]TXK68226.1 hypothetical protein FU659_34405 [Paenibacillus sp. N3.4]
MKQIAAAAVAIFNNILKVEKYMKLVISVVLIIFGVFAAALTALLWDYIYYPLIASTAEESAIAYLKASFPEEVAIDDVTYSKPFGNDEGEYFITVHPTAKPEIKLSMNVSQDFNVDEKNFKKSKWRYDTILEYVPLINEMSPGLSSYAVNMFIPADLLSSYPAETKYGEIRKLHENVTEEYLFMSVLIDRDFSEQRTLEYG